MKQISCRVDEELFAAVEAARGQVPRERWMRGALEAAMRTTEGVASGSRSGTSQANDPARSTSAPSASAPPRTPTISGRMFDATTGEETPVVQGPASGYEPRPMCRICAENGPPRNRPCPSCGWQAKQPPKET